MQPSAYPSEELAALALSLLTCSTSHTCVDAALHKPNTTAPTVRLSWNVDRCSRSKRRSRLHSAAQLSLNRTDTDAITVRCGYVFAPPPWPGVAVAPVQIADAANNSMEPVLADARVLLTQQRFTEASQLLQTVLEGSPTRPVYLEALRLQFESTLRCGLLNEAQAQLDELRAQIPATLAGTMVASEQRLQTAQQAMHNWTTLTGDEACDGVAALAQIATAGRSIRRAAADCCYQWGR